MSWAEHREITSGGAAESGGRGNVFSTGDVIIGGGFRLDKVLRSVPFYGWVAVLVIGALALRRRKG